VMGLSRALLLGGCFLLYLGLHRLFLESSLQDGSKSLERKDLLLLAKKAELEDEERSPFLPYPGSGKPDLVFDLQVQRFVDDFNLIDDDLSVEELENIFSKVVLLFANFGVYVRIDGSDLSKLDRLDRGRSLDFLAYVEGPDKAELENRQLFNEDDIDFADWVKKKYRDFYGFELLESIVNLPKDLKDANYNDNRYSFQRNLFDWIIGFPHKRTPWELVNSAVFAPVFYFHAMNGECRVGRIGGRTSSCWEHRKPILDPDSGEFIKNATCRRFEGNLRLRASKNSYYRPHEMIRMRGKTAVRMFAHEIGHNFNLHHPASACVSKNSWKEGNLMLQRRFVGLSSQKRCPATPVPEQDDALFLSKGQIETIRNAIRHVDIRPSFPVNFARTIGETTLQLGSSSPTVGSPFLEGRKAFIGSKSLEKQVGCTLQKATIVFNRIRAPVNCVVRRVRWMPFRFENEDFTLEILIVSPSGFEIQHRSGPLLVAKSLQRTHKEISNLALPMRKGDLIALSRTDGENLDVDQKLYNSSDLKYGDVSGKFKLVFNSIHQGMLQNNSEDIPWAPRFADSFHYSQKPVLPGATRIHASAAPENLPATWCAELIFNYDCELKK